MIILCEKIVVAHCHIWHKKEGRPSLRVNSRIARRCRRQASSWPPSFVCAVSAIREQVAGLAVVLLYRNVRILSVNTPMRSLRYVLPWHLS